VCHPPLALAHKLETVIAQHSSRTCSRCLNKRTQNPAATYHARSNHKRSSFETTGFAPPKHHIIIDSPLSGPSSPSISARSCGENRQKSGWFLFILLYADESQAHMGPGAAYSHFPGRCQECRASMIRSRSVNYAICLDWTNLFMVVIAMTLSTLISQARQYWQITTTQYSPDIDPKDFLLLGHTLAMT
jgi:hypothetical protein